MVNPVTGDMRHPTPLKNRRPRLHHGWGARSAGLLVDSAAPGALPVSKHPQTASSRFDD
jgi:hypothetical protein